MSWFWIKDTLSEAEQSENFFTILHYHLPFNVSFWIYPTLPSVRYEWEVKHLPGQTRGRRLFTCWHTLILMHVYMHTLWMIYKVVMFHICMRYQRHANQLELCILNHFIIQIQIHICILFLTVNTLVLFLFLKKVIFKSSNIIKTWNIMLC